MRFVVWIAEAGMRFIYFFMKLRPVKDNIVMISRQSDDVPLDFRLLCDALKIAAPEYKVEILAKKLGSGLRGAVRYLPHMLRQMSAIARARVVVLDSYSIAVSLLKHRRGLRVIQIWHAIGLLKKAGYAAVGGEEGRDAGLARLMRMHENYDYICASSDACRLGIAEVFGYDEARVVVKVLPRADYLRDNRVRGEARARFAQAYPELAAGGRKKILYAPTHRRSANGELQRNLAQLADAFDFTKYDLIVSPHPLSEISLDRKGGWFPRGFSSLELAMCCDAVVIDYSSILFEVAILGVPLYFFTYDLDAYLADPGFFIDFAGEVPGNKRVTAAEVVADIEAETYDAGTMRAFLEKYVDIDDPHCAKTLAEFVAKAGAKAGSDA
ncbi:MAG: CDP-glycerol glycerophosphotransferase family protein [Clostridiales Family XIII bacterium]|jgi:CDP-ribitol ribitolphosphotransferase|nr:CDP-glycerol glycerophosphotransferase family protein [Clostridiales Family XIII bacterium]